MEKKFNKAQFAKAEINLSEIMSKILDGYFFPYEAFKRLRCIPTKTYSLLSFLPTVFSYYSRSAQKLHCKSSENFILCVKKPFKIRYPAAYLVFLGNCHTTFYMHLNSYVKTGRLKAVWFKREKLSLLNLGNWDLFRKYFTYFLEYFFMNVNNLG